MKKLGALKASGRFPSEGVAIEIREGEYALNQSFELREEDSGTEESRIVHRGYNEEKVRVHSERIFDASHLHPVSDEAALKRIISDTARENGAKT